MKLNIQLYLGKAAADLLRKLADKLEQQDITLKDDERVERDVNGNPCLFADVMVG